MNQFTGALITGGRSHRMGADKAFIDWNGRPLWEVQLGKLRAAGAPEILVCGRREQLFAGDGFRLIPDQKEDLGPLSGLANALRTASHDSVLVMAVDMPFITTELLGELVGMQSAFSSQGVIPIRSGRFEPLAAVFPKSTLALAESRLAGTDRSLQGFCREAESAGLVRRWVVPPEHESLFQSVNSPEDLESRLR